MFHIAFPVLNLQKTVDFYTEKLNAKIGRTGPLWVDFDLYGNQITVHQSGNFRKKVPVMGKEGIPITHFGVILDLREWHEVKQKMEEHHVPFLVPPKVVFEGEVGEQYSFFVEDPNGYSIEFKGFKSLDNVFRS